MGRNLSPVVKRELENLDKDADSRKSAMKALKSYVKDLDSKAIPIFLAQVSETNDTGTTSGEYTISLYEALARVHGTKIVPQIDNIMSTIIKTLKSTVTSFALHQACSKVVPAIARYGIDPTTPDDKKRRIIHSLCKPLSDSLLANQESLSSGAALCLKALVDSDNWRFASSEMVNEVCQRVVGALEKPMQSNSHMGLVMSLAKHNSLVVEAYARLLIWSGVTILNTGASEGNSQKRLVAIQMINFLMKCLDYKCIMSELNFVIEEMEKCEGEGDQMAYVKGAAFEAMETAKRILIEKGSKFKQNGKKGESDFTLSPESQTMGSFGGYTSMVDSPVSVVDSSKSVSRKLWRHDNGVVDVSLKDGLFSSNRSVNENGFCEDEGDYEDGFSGFFQKSSRSVTPSPQRARSYMDIENVKMYTTPRKHVDENVVVSDLSDCVTHEDDEHDNLTSESMCSTQVITHGDELVLETKATVWLFGYRFVFGFVALFAMIVCFLLVGDLQEDFNLVPT
ncbi:protein SINE1 [Lactuca sativa]|uniref:TORTIFOLIA1/SINE1-2 N-terminal domain-containing protein n=1 Tax=Lactuca sativa TaxID=4236 RepID=A0A9R1WD98_LACSA|nr:protein SINE1 [Lactuca sativa]KAJ0223040.1 hypothetical protein LSAT_V11C200070920 [Lactuca sativa]